MNGPSRRPRRLVVILSVIFVLAVVMGTGPGIYLVNPNPNDPQGVITFLGLPILYAWIVWWFLVQAAVILVAYYHLWDGGESDGPGSSDSLPDRTGEVNP